MDQNKVVYMKYIFFVYMKYIFFVFVTWKITSNTEN